MNRVTEPWFDTPDEKCLCGHLRSLHHLAGVEDGGCLHVSSVLLSPCNCLAFEAANSHGDGE